MPALFALASVSVITQLGKNFFIKCLDIVKNLLYDNEASCRCHYTCFFQGFLLKVSSLSSKENNWVCADSTISSCFKIKLSFSIKLKLSFSGRPKVFSCQVVFSARKHVILQLLQMYLTSESYKLISPTVSPLVKTQALNKGKMS